MPIVILNGRKFRYQVVKKFIRSLNLRLKSRQSFIVTAPKITSLATIDKFVQNHSLWIIKNSQKLARKKHLLRRRSLTILGKPYGLVIHSAARDSLVAFDEDQKIYLNTTNLTNSHLSHLLDTKMRPFALKIISSHLSLLSSRFGFKYRRVTVRNSSSRFGSCSHQNNLNFNWQIIFFPEDKFIHILLHELTHTIVKNHSPKFWSQLTLYDPHCATNRRWLKTEGSKHFVV